jgi:DNA transformation protein
MTTKQTAFSSLHNLGLKSQQMLLSAGIPDIEALNQLGAVRAFLKVKATGAPASLNLLWALEGAISGLHWREVAREHRTSLLLALEMAQEKSAPQSKT